MLHELLKNRIRIDFKNSLIAASTTYTSDQSGVTPGADPCTEHILHCQQIECPQGKEAFVDSAGCQRCRCFDLCDSKQCPEGTRCVVQDPDYRHSSEPTAICVATGKFVP